MLYAFADTDIFVRIITQGRPGCEPSHFEDLTTLVEGSVVCLLVPEVLLLELEKQLRLLPKQFESHCDKLTNSLTKATENVWNGIDALKVALLHQISNYKKAKLDECEKTATQIMGFLQSTSVQAIPLTSDIWLNTQHRLIAGRMPRPKDSSNQDTALVESLVAFFREAHDDQARLLFCSENEQDFAVECAARDKDKVFALHPLVQNDLPQTAFSASLKAMLAFAHGYESLPEVDDEQIQAAAQTRDLHDEEGDEYWASQRIILELIEKKSSEQFRNEVLPSLPADVNTIRAELAAEIGDLLRRCRTCSTWDDRSEYKLPQWIEYVPENMIPYTSVPKMVRIKRSLDEYLRLHEGLLPPGT